MESHRRVCIVLHLQIAQNQVFLYGLTSGEMRFDAPETFNDVEVVITELSTGCSFTYYLTNGEASLFVELNSGAYSILYITEKGVYEGCLDIP